MQGPLGNPACSRPGGHDGRGFPPQMTVTLEPAGSAIPAHCPARSPYPNPQGHRSLQTHLADTAAKVTRAPPRGGWPDAQLLFCCPTGFCHPRTQALTFPSAFQLSSSAPCLACGGPPTLQNGFHNRAVSCSEPHSEETSLGPPETAELQEPCPPVTVARELLRWSLQVGLRFPSTGPAGPSLCAPRPRPRRCLAVSRTPTGPPGRGDG